MTIIKETDYKKQEVKCSICGRKGFLWSIYEITSWSCKDCNEKVDKSIK